MNFSNTTKIALVLGGVLGAGVIGMVIWRLVFKESNKSNSSLSASQTTRTISSKEGGRDIKIPPLNTSIPPKIAEDKKNKVEKEEKDDPKIDVNGFGDVEVNGDVDRDDTKASGDKEKETKVIEKPIILWDSPVTLASTPPRSVTNTQNFCYMISIFQALATFFPTLEPFIKDVDLSVQDDVTTFLQIMKDFTSADTKRLNFSDYPLMKAHDDGFRAFISSSFFCRLIEYMESDEVRDRGLPMHLLFKAREAYDGRVITFLYGPMLSTNDQVFGALLGMTYERHNVNISLGLE